MQNRITNKYKAAQPLKSRQERSADVHGMWEQHMARPVSGFHLVESLQAGLVQEPEICPPGSGADGEEAGLVTQQVYQALGWYWRLSTQSPVM